MSRCAGLLDVHCDESLAAPGCPQGWGIGIASSPDLVHWSKVGELPGHPGEVEEKGVAAPAAIVLDGRVHLFYQTYGNGKNDAICHAVSDDGIHFDRDPGNPVFHPSGAWNCGRAIDADVIAWKGLLWLYFATRDPQMEIQQLGVATAPLNSAFGRCDWTDRSLSGPILKPELPWEKKCIEAPTTCQRDGRLYLFYAGGYNNEPQQIGLAVSDDGLHWQRASTTPFLPHGPEGSWNSSESGHPGVFVDTDGRSYLFYQGNPDHGETWRLGMVELNWVDGVPLVK